MTGLILPGEGSLSVGKKQQYRLSFYEPDGEAAGRSAGGMQIWLRAGRSG